MYANMKNKINGLSQGSRSAALILGGALIIVLGWFGASTHIHTLSKSMQKSQLEYHNHISAASDLLDNTDRIVYIHQLADIEDVTQFLQNNIAKQNNLQLIAIERHVPINLSADDFNQKLSKENTSELALSDLYAYDVTIDLVGDYFNFLDYLKMVAAQSKYNFYWVKIDYNVVDYPTSEIKIVVRTINHKSS
jgi:hypothetical protein